MTTSIDQAALADLIAKDQIRELALLYSRGVDRKDYDLIRSLYTLDGTDAHGPNYYPDVDSFIAALGRALPTQRGGGHYVCNHLISVVDGEHAEGEVYVLAIHLTKDAAGVWHEDLIRVRYFDRYRIEDGRWRFASRVVAFDHMAAREIPEPAEPADPASDLSYALKSRVFARGTRG